MLPRLALTFALALVASPRVALAQTLPSSDAQPAVQIQQYDAPAYVAVVDGSATLERDGRIESAPLNMPLLSGDRLRTADGRVEVRFADGGRLHLDARTSLDVLSDELVRLGDGRIRLSMQRTQQVSYRVDSPVGSVRITQPGEYRIALVRTQQETQLEFAVIRGAGEIFTEQGTTAVRSGERAYSSAGLAPSYAYTYNSANMDDFDRWSEMQRGTVYASSSQSSQYLPADMTSYASTFDQYGDWRYDQTYGQVWYPRVASDWRPYYYGRWASYPTYGWTWIAGDPFGYPTHHYGRWGFSANAWFWIPTPYWGPAYVSWAYAPSYVSWCPLGWNNYAVFSIGYYNAGRYRGHYYSPWTTVPHGYFGHGYYAHQHAVNWDRPGYSGARPRFTESRTGPARDTAIARGSTPVRYVGTRAASSGTAFGAGRNAPASPAFGGGRSAPAFGGGRNAPAFNGATSGGARAPGTGGDRAVDRRAGPVETPRYINRGDQIVRSQTERPIPPARDVPRTAPQGVARDRGFGEGGVSRAMPQGGDPGSRAYDRAAPRQEAQVDTRTFERPGGGARVFDRPNAGSPVYDRPYPGNRVYERPSIGDRAYERPYGGRVEPSRPMERATPPPMERSAPPAPQRMPQGSGVERAMPRGGGAPPPPSRAGGGGSTAPSRAGGGGTSAPSHRGGGRR